MNESPLKIVINCPLNYRQAAQLRALSGRIHLEFVPLEADELPASVLADAEIVYTNSAPFDPADAPKLRWIQTNTAAANLLFERPIWKTKIPMANVSGAYSVAVAECAMAMLLGLSRKVPAAVRMQERRIWDESQVEGIDLHGKTMGMIGYGSIGRQIARVAHAMGMTILACKRRPEQRHDGGYLIPGTGDPTGALPAKWFGIDEMPEMLAQCDIAMITLPLTEHTRGIFGRHECEALPRHAWVLNLGRGPVVDEAALTLSLQDGTIAGAALDVFEIEPLPDASPLWDMPNVLMMPHVGSWTNVQAERAGAVLIENVRRDLAGEPLLNVVDREFGY